MKTLLTVNKIGVIGLNKKQPWKSKEALDKFNELTEGSTCLVGRKTYESLPYFKTLKLIVVGKGESYYYDNLNDAMAFNKIKWIIGGESVFKQTLKYCDELHLIIVNDYSEGNVKCPDLTEFNGEIFIHNCEAN